MPDFGDGNGREQWEGTVDPLAPSVANGQITPAQWAEYQAKRRRDAIMGTLLTLGGMFGAQPLANAVGVGSAANGAAGIGPQATGASYPGAGLFGAPGSGAVGGAGANMAAGATGAGAAGGTAATVAGGAGGSGAGAGVGKGLLAGMSARDLAALGLGLGGTIGGALTKPQDTAPSSATSDPAMQELLSLMSGRLRKSEPLHDSVLSMANGLLPIQYQKGGGGVR